FVLLDRLALVVEHDPAGADPSGVGGGLDKAARSVPHERTRPGVRSRNSCMALRRDARLRLDLLLDLTAEPVRVGETDLDPGLLTGGEVVEVRLAREGGGEGRLTRAPKTVEVVDDPSGRLAEHRRSAHLGVGREVLQRGERRIWVDILQHVAETLSDL